MTEREELLNLYNLLAQTQTRVSVSEQETTATDDNLPPDGRVSGNPELEREMFEFDKRKWTDEIQMRRAEERRREAELKTKEDEMEERRFRSEGQIQLCFHCH